MKKALLLGNGLNRLDKNYSWAQLIDDLIDFVEPTTELKATGKPFSLFYEEIVQAFHGFGRMDYELKVKIANLVTQIGTCPLHARLSGLKVSEILTTNYDYNVERTCWQGVTPISEDTSERRYSLFRRKTFPDVDVWHIHGERDHPDSILLGYEHYAGYLQAMRNYATQGRKTRNLPPLIDRIKDKRLRVKESSWVDFFFNRNLFILGLTLDYVEMHLWWLIIYRARLESEQGIPIKNKITYIYPKFISQSIRPRPQLMQTFNIELHRIDNVAAGDWLDFYDQALTVVENAP
jgi:hypothetical protein